MPHHDLDRIDAMPANLLMSWEPKGRRWWKMEGGKRFVVSVRQLRKIFADPRIPETKDGSYPWANRWWLGHGQSSTPTATEPTRRLEYRDLETGEPTGVFEEVPQSEIDRHRARRDDLRRRVEALIHPVRVPSERLVGSLVARYLDSVLARHRAGEISVAAFANARSGLYHFRDWCNPQTSVDDLTVDRWDAYYLALIGTSGPKSVITRRKHFQVARNFLTWLDDLGIHPAPKNLARRQYRFKGGAQAVPTIPTVKVREVLAAARGQMLLHVLLMLNCGMTQQDISDLHPSEVDWCGSRIRRKRSKTGEHDNVPLVEYPLWAQTFALLQQYRTPDPDHVLLTETGKTWIRDRVKADGSRSRTDAIQSVYRHVQVPGKPPLKLFRKTSATLLDGSDHGKYAIHFLGQAPVDVAHKHYIQSNGPGFDDAVHWLGEQYGCCGSSTDQGS